MKHNRKRQQQKLYAKATVPFSFSFLIKGPFLEKLLGQNSSALKVQFGPAKGYLKPDAQLCSGRNWVCFRQVVGVQTLEQSAAKLIAQGPARHS